jgi:DNA-binding MarR family transcriptional regulator
MMARIKETSRLVNKYIDAYFYRKARFSFIKFMVLKVLATKNGVMTPTEIAEWTQTERHNITTLIRRLMKEDLVLTKPSDKDRRSTEVILTDKGQEKLKEVMPVANELIDQIMSSFTEADAEKFSQMLELLRGNAYDGLDSITKI